METNSPYQNELIERAVAFTGHDRFRELLDPGSPDYDPRYWEHVARLASRRRVSGRPRPTPDAPPAPAPAADLLRNARGCPRRAPVPDAERIGCGCSHRCEADPHHSPRDDRSVTVLDCWACPIAPRHSWPAPAEEGGG